MDHLDPETQDEIDAAKARERQRRADEDLRWQMSGPRGRRIAYQHLEQCGVYRTSFSTDAGVTAYNEGRRMIGLVLLADIMRVCPEKFTVMLQEHEDDRSAGDRRRTN